MPITKAVYGHNPKPKKPRKDEHDPQHTFGLTSFQIAALAHLRAELS